MSEIINKLQNLLWLTAPTGLSKDAGVEGSGLRVSRKRTSEAPKCSGRRLTWTIQARHMVRGLLTSCETVLAGAFQQHDKHLGFPATKCPEVAASSRLLKNNFQVGTTITSPADIP